MAVETIWAGEEKKGPPIFDGILILSNISEFNRKSIPAEFLETISEEVRVAHASGWMVLYLCDSRLGIEQPPIDFDEEEDGDFVRLLRPFAGVDELDLDILPDKRSVQLSSLLAKVKEFKSHWDIKGKARISGICKIGGSPVCLPATDIS